MAEELKTLEESYESLAAALKAKQEWQRKILDVLPLAEGEHLDAVVDRIKLLVWLHAEAVWRASQFQYALRMERQVADGMTVEIGRLRREVEFEACGGDNFSAADALAEGRPQCAVHPEGGTA